MCLFSGGYFSEKYLWLKMGPACLVFVGVVEGGQSVQMTDTSTLVLQSCTDVHSVECGLCSEGGVQSADDSSSVVSFKIEEEEIHIKEEEEPIPLLSSIKDEPEVSPQTFHQYIRLLSVILPFCLPAFTHKSAHNVNGNGLYIFRECVKCEG
jgi:hypothetical protein